MRGSPGAATTPAKFHHGAARVLPSLSDDDEEGASGRGLHSLTCQLNLSCFGE